MQKAPKSVRLHIGLFGRRNVGKSSLLNALTRQSVAIVSEVAGTTTDPIEKPMELLPVGPVLFIDTAGVDDVGKLGQLRVEKTEQIFDRTDLALLVTDNGQWGDYERQLLAKLQELTIPVVVVFNKSDFKPPDASILDLLTKENVSFVLTVASTGQGVADLREQLILATPDEFINSPTILGDLAPPGEMVIFVVPIDKEAPKGRLILPQVQSIRDVLDNDSYCMVVKERELRDALDRLNRRPALVVTDSQAFLKVAADTPAEIAMTSFSILFARNKGDLCEFVRGALAIDNLNSSDKILICESCSHHPSCEDIGRVKIPRWLRQYIGGDLDFDVFQGHDFPDDVGRYQLLIHCGSCMWNRREVLSRTLRCRQAGTPITNYGLAIAYTLGVFERALQPFPAALDTYHQAMK